MKIPLPGTLKKQLVDDWEFVTQLGKVCCCSELLAFALYELPPMSAWYVMIEILKRSMPCFHIVMTAGVHRLSDIDCYVHFTSLSVGLALALGQELVSVIQDLEQQFYGVVFIIQ